MGKSTLLNAVIRSHKAPAENYPFCTIEPNLGVVSVPDPRLPDPRLPQLGKVVKVNTLIPTAFEFSKYQSSLLTLPERADKDYPYRGSFALSVLRQYAMS